MDSQDSYWLLIDGNEDEPAAFGVPPYIGFHCRYIAGVLEKKNIPYKYLTIDQWRLEKIEDPNKLAGLVILAGAVVPGKYLRGTPISLNETERIISNMTRKSHIFNYTYRSTFWSFCTTDIHHLCTMKFTRCY